MRTFVAVLLSLASLSAAAAPQSFTGVITDDMCDDGDHRYMRMGETAAECVKACVDAHGASYVLYDGTRVYALSDQATTARYAGRKVTVTGTLDEDGKRIQVNSVAAAE